MTEQKKPRRPRGLIQLIEGKCIACGGRCEAECPRDAIVLNDKGEPVIDLEKCISCQRCIKVCPAAAIEVFYTPEELKILEELDAQKKAALGDALRESGVLQHPADSRSGALKQA